MGEDKKTEINKEEVEDKEVKTTVKKEEGAETATKASETKKESQSKKVEKEIQSKETKPEKKQAESKATQKTKKKHRVLKTLLWIIVIALILFLIHFARNYILVSKMKEKMDDLRKVTNYSCITENYTANLDKKTIAERYYKDGRSMCVLSKGESKMILWYDANTREQIMLIPQEFVAIVTKDSDGFLPAVMSSPIYFDEEMLKWSFMFFITSDEIDGQECYKVNWGGTTWINKENGTVLRSINGKIVIDGKDYDNIVEYKDWKLNTLTDENLARPNLMGYKVQEQ